MRSRRLLGLALGLSVLVQVTGCGTSSPAGSEVPASTTSTTPTGPATPTSPASPAAPTSPATQSGADPSPSSTRLTGGGSAWVSVSVATLWRSRSSPRAVDAPALAQPARIRQWLDTMTLDQRRGLAGRADTQALLGDRVRVLRVRPHWVKVAVPSQPTPLDPRGYPGWVPRRQVTAVVPPTTARQATVVERTAWLRADTAEAPRVIPVSFGTRLPVAGTGPRWVRVWAPGGVVRRLARAVVAVHDTGAPALSPTRDSLVATARSFLGLDYLWSGVSGFGVDCSGLTWLDYRVHGIRLPRDAEPQSRHGTKVADPRRADLLFFATGGVVHHVAMYVGQDRMLHAPRTGSTVQVVPTATMAGEYAGARRYLP